MTPDHTVTCLIVAHEGASAGNLGSRYVQRGRVRRRDGDNVGMRCSPCRSFPLLMSRPTLQKDLTFGCGREPGPLTRGWYITTWSKDSTQSAPARCSPPLLVSRSLFHSYCGRVAITIDLVDGRKKRACRSTRKRCRRRLHQMLFRCRSTQYSEYCSER